MTFFIFGAGYSGQAFAAAQKRPVYGTTRATARFDTLRAANIHPLLFNGRDLASPLTSASLICALAKTTHLIISIPPDNQGDPVLALPGLRRLLPALQWIGYLSTVGVYGDHHGRHVDETAPCRATLPRNVRRIEAEKNWRHFADAHHIPLAVLRLAGIYGSGRNAFVKLRQGNAHRIIKPGQVFNRIHVADIAGAIQHLADKKRNGIFNISDDEPAPPQDVITFAAKLMNMEPPPEIPFEKASLSPMARSFYGDNKRVSNELLGKSGYHLLYSNYRRALTHMWQSQRW